jgi:hypothetical protein
MKLLTFCALSFTALIITSNSFAGRIINKNNPGDVVEIVKSQGMVQIRATWGTQLKEIKMHESTLSNKMDSNKRDFRKGIAFLSDGNGWFYSRKYVLGLDRPYSITAENLREVSYQDFGLDHIVFIPIVAGLETFILPISGTASIIKNVSTNRDVKMIKKAMEGSQDVEVSENRFIRVLHYLDLIPFRWD